MKKVLSVLVGVSFWLSIPAFVLVNVLFNFHVKVIQSAEYQIGDACDAFRQTKGGLLPTGRTSNEAFRQLRESGILEDDRTFWISSMWSPKRVARDEFILPPGYCHYYLVQQETTANDDKGVAFIFAFLRAPSGELKDVVFTTKHERISNVIHYNDESELNQAFFAKRYGVDPKNVLFPEGVPIPPKPWISMNQICLIPTLIILTIWLIRFIRAVANLLRPKHPDASAPACQA